MEGFDRTDRIDWTAHQHHPPLITFMMAGTSTNPIHTHRPSNLEALTLRPQATREDSKRKGNRREKRGGKKEENRRRGKKKSREEKKKIG